MLNNNPFAEISALVPPSAMQTFVLVMIVFVVAGTLFDVLHKRSARYFFDSWKKGKQSGSRNVGGGEMVSIAVQTVAVDMLTSGEFCNMRRRIAHLLTMYGFVAWVCATTVLVFQYPTPATPAPAIWLQL